MKNIFLIENLNENDVNILMEVWESSVLGTHDFLSEKDFFEIKRQLKSYLPKFNNYYIYKDEEKIKGFLKVENGNIEMLFIDNLYRGKGIGKRLILFAIENLDAISLDVNEDNIQARKFYEHMGFKTISRMEKDGQGRDYPILHMSL